MTTRSSSTNLKSVEQKINKIINLEIIFAKYIHNLKYLYTLFDLYIITSKNDNIEAEVAEITNFIALYCDDYLESDYICLPLTKSLRDSLFAVYNECVQIKDLYIKQYNNIINILKKLKSNEIIKSKPKDYYEFMFAFLDRYNIFDESESLSVGGGKKQTKKPKDPSKFDGPGPVRKPRPLRNNEPTRRTTRETVYRGFNVSAKVIIRIKLQKIKKFTTNVDLLLSIMKNDTAFSKFSKAVASQNNNLLSFNKITNIYNYNDAIARDIVLNIIEQKRQQNAAALAALLAPAALAAPAAPGPAPAPAAPGPAPGPAPGSASPSSPKLLTRIKRSTWNTSNQDQCIETIGENCNDKCYLCLIDTPPTSAYATTNNCGFNPAEINNNFIISKDCEHLLFFDLAYQLGALYGNTLYNTTAVPYANVQRSRFFRNNYRWSHARCNRNHKSQVAFIKPVKDAAGVLTGNWQLDDDMITSVIVSILIDKKWQNDIWNFRDKSKNQFRASYNWPDNISTATVSPAHITQLVDLLRTNINNTMAPLLNNLNGNPQVAAPPLIIPQYP